MPTLWCLSATATTASRPLRTDIIAVGKVKARIVNGLFDRLDYLEETQTEVPLSTVFAPNLFTGMGPRVKVGLAGLAQMEAPICQRVYLGGHQPDAPPVLIEVHAGFRILTPFGGKTGKSSRRTRSRTRLSSARLPERYAYISGSDSDLLGEIRDYEENSDISHETRK